MDERTGSEPEGGPQADPQPPEVARAAGADDRPGDAESPHTWIALPVGRAETGPTIAQLVEAVRAAGGMVGGQALFDPRYEPEMRRFLMRALEMEGIPLPKGGDTP